MFSWVFTLHALWGLARNCISEGKIQYTLGLLASGEGKQRKEVWEDIGFKIRNMLGWHINTVKTHLNQNIQNSEKS